MFYQNHAFSALTERRDKADANFSRVMRRVCDYLWPAN
jgi:hypothetical protein